MNDPTFQLPVQRSTFAADVDWVYYVIFWLSVVLFVGIVASMVYLVWKYRARPGHKAEPTGHNLPLELTWTIAPVFILAALFHWGFKGYLDMATPPAGALEIRVRAFQWGWDFEYPNGAHAPNLRVPVGRPVKLVMSSNDVIHAFYAPSLRIKRDLVPGMYTTLWFQATQTGTDDILCAEYCGGTDEKGHWAMLSKLTIESPSDFDRFLNEGQGPRAGETVVQWGERLAQDKACKGCHSTDGTRLAGPTWKGIFGTEEELATGAKVKVDENYLRESMLDPNAKVVKGFPPVMPTFKGILTDKEIDALVEYIKTVK